MDCFIQLSTDEVMLRVDESIKVIPEEDTSSDV